MQRVCGIETEYGFLVRDSALGEHPELIIARVKNALFFDLAAGTIDLHHRDYEEPPGNGGFLDNGGRVYMDMGHLEYSSPECRGLWDMVACDRAGDLLVRWAVEAIGLERRVAFIKNNIDHYTGATFGSHENYSMSRATDLGGPAIDALLAFLATRLLFAGAGRVGAYRGEYLFGEREPARGREPIRFQLSQRADHIVNDIYQWVQFNRALLNSRDEPLADPRHYRRLHLLLGDANILQYALALRIGATALALDLVEAGATPPIALQDPVLAMRALSRDASRGWEVVTQSGKRVRALDVQRAFLERARAAFAGRDEETDWILREWASTLDALGRDPRALVGKIDWVTKEWLLSTFAEAEGIDWSGPVMRSLDLAYHDIAPASGLALGLEQEGVADRLVTEAQVERAATTPPADTRAHARGTLARLLRGSPYSYLINWDTVSADETRHLYLGDPLRTYGREAKDFAQSLFLGVSSEAV